MRLFPKEITATPCCIHKNVHWNTPLFKLFLTISFLVAVLQSRGRFGVLVFVCWFRELTYFDQDVQMIVINS